MEIGQFVEEVCHMTESDQSESLLEIVPVLTVLEGKSVMDHLLLHFNQSCYVMNPYVIFGLLID